MIFPERGGAYAPPLPIPGLKPLQARALGVLSSMDPPDGLFLGAGVGHGKTLVGLLSAGVTGAKRAVYLTRPKLVPQVERDIQHWSLFGGSEISDLLLSSIPKVVGYGALSSITRGEDLLEALQPDLLILDEAHELGSLKSARTRRIERYLKKNQDTRVVAMTGTITRTTLLDHAHLIRWALPRSAHSRIPWSVLMNWDAVIAPGSSPDQLSWSSIFPLLQWAGEEATVEGARRAYHELLEATPGIVLTDDSATDAGLSIRDWTTPLCPELEGAIRDLQIWRLPSGKEIVDAVELSRARSSLAVGFYYNRPDPEPWVKDAREAWSEVIQKHLRRPYNSEGLVAKAAKEGALGDQAKVSWERWEKARKSWPIGSPVWISDEVLRNALTWGEGPPTIIWTSSAPVMRMFRALGARTYGMGSQIPCPEVSPLAVASIRVHGTGSNLQGYRRALVLEPPTSGAGWEQLIGRHHRPGVRGDVEVHIYKRSWNKLGSTSQAEYLQEVTATPQKLFLGGRQ